MFWNLYLKVCGVNWLWVWFVYWFGLMTFHASREKPEVYVPWFVSGAIVLTIANVLWLVVRGIYLLG